VKQTFFLVCLLFIKWVLQDPRRNRGRFGRRQPREVAIAAAIEARRVVAHTLGAAHGLGFRPTEQGGKAYGINMEATQTTERAAANGATNGKTLSRRLDTESFMEVFLPAIQNCFGELSGDGTASTALRKADYEPIMLRLLRR